MYCFDEIRALFFPLGACSFFLIHAVHCEKNWIINDPYTRETQSVDGFVPAIRHS